MGTGAPAPKKQKWVVEVEVVNDKVKQEARKQ